MHENRTYISLSLNILFIMFHRSNVPVCTTPIPSGNKLIWTKYFAYIIALPLYVIMSDMLLRARVCGCTSMSPNRTINIFFAQFFPFRIHWLYFGILFASNLDVRQANQWNALVTRPITWECRELSGRTDPHFAANEHRVDELLSATSTSSASPQTLVSTYGPISINILSPKHLCAY